MAAPSEENTERDASAGHVGALLQASRQRLGEDLPDVALMLRIRLPYLAAIEAGRYRELPGATYAVGFIRAYAEHLGLDSEEVVRRFKAETIDGGTDQKLSFPTPVPETGIPGGAYVFIGLVIAVLAYGAWYVSTTEDGYFADLISPLDEQLSNLLSDDDDPASPEKGETDDKPTSEPSASTEPEPMKPAEPAEAEEKAEAGSEANPAESTTEPAPVTAEPQAENSEATETPTIAATTPAETPSAIQPNVSAEPVETATSTVAETSTTPPVVAEQAAETIPPVAGSDQAEAPAVASATAPAAEPVPVPPVDTESQSVATATQTAVADATPQVVVPAIGDVEQPEPSNLTVAVPEPEVVRPVQPVEPISEVADAVATAPDIDAQGPEPIATAESEPVDVFSSAPIQSETEPAPIVSSLGTESEIAAPEPPPVPAQAEPVSEPQGAEIASVNSPPEQPAEGQTRITINAKNNSWIQVRDDVANQMLVTRLLTAGDSFEVPDRPGLVLLTGNAGALEIVVDGTAVPSIGGNGVVRRGVVLEPERLKGGTAVTN